MERNQLIESTLREVADRGRAARDEVEDVLDVALDNRRYYRLLAVVDALSADVATIVQRALAAR
jgi:hypothetical protein